MVYNSNKNYFELLRDINEVSIHQSHLRALINEAFKSQSFKYSESIVELKAKMKDLGDIDCSCILCR